MYITMIVIAAIIIVILAAIAGAVASIKKEPSSGNTPGCDQKYNNQSSVENKVIELSAFGVSDAIQTDSEQESIAENREIDEGNNSKIEEEPVLSAEQGENEAKSTGENIDTSVNTGSNVQEVLKQSVEDVPGDILEEAVEVTEQSDAVETVEKEEISPEQTTAEENKEEKSN